MSHLTQSGMPKGKPFPENELVWIDCPNSPCEYHVRVHNSTVEANLRQHKEKGCPLKTNPEDVESAPKGNPLGHQGVESSLTVDPLRTPYGNAEDVPGHGARPSAGREEPMSSPPTHSWEPLSRALRDMGKGTGSPLAEDPPRVPGLLKGHLDDLDAMSAPRTFDTGATRDTDDGKYDYEGFFSPLVLERFAEYMHYHRYQSDGTLRDSDNWQRGIPLDEYMKSGFRHFMDWWLIHRGNTAGKDDIADVLCAVLFNVQGYLHELLRARDSKADEGQYR